MIYNAENGDCAASPKAAQSNQKEKEKTESRRTIVSV